MYIPCLIFGVEGEAQGDKAFNSSAESAVETKQVGDGLDPRGAATSASPNHREGHTVTDGFDVVAVHRYPRHSVGHSPAINPVSYTYLRAHETLMNFVCRLLLEKKKNPPTINVKTCQHNAP